MDALELLGHARIVPVVVIDDVDFAVPLAETLVEAGLDVIEVTLRTESALDAIAAMAKAVPQAIVGAGSIRDREQFQFVKDAGGRFAVSPGHSNNLAVAAEPGLLPVPVAVQAIIVWQTEPAWIFDRFFGIGHPGHEPGQADQGLDGRARLVLSLQCAIKERHIQRVPQLGVVGEADTSDKEVGVIGRLGHQRQDAT